MMGKNRSLVDRTEFILERCKGKRVLHLGCTNYPYTNESIQNGMLIHARLAEVAVELVGLDADLAGIEQLAAEGFSDVIYADLEELNKLELGRTFDVIVAGEMIEHLNNPGRFLSGVKRFMANGTELLITTINAYCGMRFLYYGIRGKGGVAEPVHPDHVSYYSYSTLKLLVQRHGMAVEDFRFYDIGKEHRPHNRWFLNLTNDICVRISPQWADGIIAVCKIN